MRNRHTVGCMVFAPTDEEQRVLRRALEGYRNHAAKRVVPGYRPPAGQADRNRVAMEVASRLLTRMPEPGLALIEGTSREVRLAAGTL